MSQTRTRRTDHGSFIVDAQGSILGFDQGMELLTGWPAADVVGRNKDLVGSRHADSTGEKIAARMYEGEIPIVPGAKRTSLKLYCRDGRQVWVEAVVHRMTGPGQRAQVTILRSLSRSAETDSPQSRDRRDPLTGLLNREAFYAQIADDLQAATGRARPLALVLADVDHLRLINERRGRDAGDEILEQLAGILRVSVDDEQRIYRLGADDFAILLPSSGRGEARRIAAALRSTVERFRFTLSSDFGSETHITLSLGAASFPTDADNPVDLIERAEEALEEARNMGRNRVWCYLRRPRVPLETPVYFDGAEPLLVGYARDLSPSGMFVQTAAPIDLGMRCAFAFSLPGVERKVHVIGRVVRTVPPELTEDARELRIPGMGVEFERFGGRNDRQAIDGFVHGRENSSLRPEHGTLSF